jgi:hypothetical protein
MRYWINMNLKPASSTKISDIKIEPEMVCPVCNLDHIPYRHDLCPQCDADLTCFKALDRLTAAVAPNSNPLSPPSHEPKQKHGTMIAFMVIGLALLGMGFMGFVFYKIQMIYSRLTLQQTTFKRAVETMVSRADLIVAKQNQIVSRITQQLEYERRLLAEKQTPAARSDAKSAINIKKGGALDARSFKEQLRRDAHVKASKVESNGADRWFDFYQASDTDTLWGIAERFYGAGYLYPVLLEHNPELSIYHISRRDRITILKDVKEVRRIYHTITVYEGKQLYWYYTVRSGDTPSNIKARYCIKQDCLPAIFYPDSNTEIPPGIKVKIALGKTLK